MALENYHKTGQITHPKETTPPFADPSSHYWEDISRKVSIKQNGHFNYSRKEKIKFLKKKKKNQVADVQEASKTKEYTVVRGTDTSIWIA